MVILRCGTKFFTFRSILWQKMKKGGLTNKDGHGHPQDLATTSPVKQGNLPVMKGQTFCRQRAESHKEAAE